MAASGRKVASAYVDIGAKYSEFTKGMANIKKAMAGLRPQFDAIRSMAKGIFVGLTGYAAVATAAYAEDERAQQRLKSALSATGQEVDANAARLAAFASAVQGATIYGDEATVGLMAYATNLGVTADQMEDVIKLGIGLGESFFDGNAQAGVDAAAKAMQGNMKALARLIPGMKAATTAQEQFALVQKAGNAGWQQAQDRTKTTTGALAQMKNAVGDVGEAVGKVLAPYVVGLSSKLRSLAEAFTRLQPVQVQQVVRWGAIAAGVAGVIILLPRVISMIGGVITAFGAIAKIGALVFTVLANPIGLAIALIGGLGYAIYKMGIVSTDTLDSVFGSLPGLFKGLSTLWSQAGHILLTTMYRLKAGFLSAWEDIKLAGITVFYSWGGALADWASKTWATVRETGLKIQAFWDDIKSLSELQVAESIIKKQAESDVRQQFKVGTVVDDKQVNKIAASLYSNAVQGGVEGANFEDIRKRVEANWKGLAINEQNIVNLIGVEQAVRLNEARKAAVKEHEARKKEMAERVDAINKGTDQASKDLAEWEKGGTSGALKENQKRQGEIAAQRRKDLDAAEAAQAADLAKDLESIKDMPKLSDQIKALLEKVKQGLGFSEIQKTIEDIQGGLADTAKKTMGGANKLNMSPAGLGSGQSIDDATQSRIRLLAANDTNKLDPKSNEAARMRLAAMRQRQSAVTLLEAIKVNTAKRQLAQLG